jgi:hypothetical protein
MIGVFLPDLYALFYKICNEMDRWWKIIIFIMHLFNARKASLASRVPSFCSNISPKLARIFTLTEFRLLPKYWGREKGVFFYEGGSPSKLFFITPYWETVQALSKAGAFLLSWNKRKLLCMGRTYAAKRRTLLKKLKSNLFQRSREVRIRTRHV